MRYFPVNHRIFVAAGYPDWLMTYAVSSAAFAFLFFLLLN